MSRRMTMTSLLAALLLMVSSVASVCGMDCGVVCGASQPMVAMHGMHDAHDCCANAAVIAPVCEHGVDAAQPALPGAPVALGAALGASMPTADLRVGVPAGLVARGLPPLLRLPMALRVTLRV